MTPFSETAGPPSRRALERILARVEAEVAQTYGPLGDLGIAIVTAAWDTQQRLGPAFGFSSSGRPSMPQMLLQYELLYFFSHLTLRTAFAEGFTGAQIGKLQTFLGPLIVSTAVDSFCLHWPEDLKKKMRSEVYERLNYAEMEYAECMSLSDPDDPLNRGTLIGRLATNAM